MAQEWEFAKEKDGIRIYTRQEKESSFKAFKGETDLHATVEEVLATVEDVAQFTKWDEDVSEIRILEHELGKSLKYYVVYDIPWPFKDRDLCIDAHINSDPSTGGKMLIAGPIPEAVPLNDENVRITEYWQKWIIAPLANGLVHVTIEGFADPAGDVPAWVVNMAITDTPLNMLRGIGKSLE